MIRVLLGLGSNKSFNNMAPLDLLKCACKELSGYLVKPSFSSVYKTKAMYVEDQDDFYNMCAYGFVPDDLSPFELLKKVNEIEAAYGRDRSKEIRFGARSLDIDIELFGDQVINHPDLQIPHPRVEERLFVLIPATEVLKETADELLRGKYIESLEVLKNKNMEDFESIKKVVPAQVVQKWNRN